MKGFNEGAFSPLLFAWRSATVLGVTLLLFACSRHQQPPPFSTSGYVADHGVVRLWRKDSGDGAVHLFSVLSPWETGATVTSEYRWQGDNLTLIELNIYSDPPEHSRVRFDSRSEVSFMQRERKGQKQQLSKDEIALWRYQAVRARTISDELRVGRVVLRQGRWNADRTVTTCTGETVNTGFDKQQLRRIAGRQRNAVAPVSVAWLEAPKGTQLLLVANSDYCRWQPRPEDF